MNIIKLAQKNRIASFHRPLTDQAWAGLEVETNWESAEYEQHHVGVVSLGGVPFLHNFGPSTARNNTFLGAAVGNMSPNLTGTVNTGVAFGALNALISGAGNVAFGFNALLLNATASRNSSFGSQALQYDSTGNDNSAAGFRALYNNTPGVQNSAFTNNTQGPTTRPSVTFALNQNTASGNAAFGCAALDITTPRVAATLLSEPLHSWQSIGTSDSAFGSGALANNNDPAT